VGWIRRTWDWLGKASDAWGRLAFLLWIVGGAAVVIAVAVRAFGPWRFALLVVGLSFVIMGSIGFWRQRARRVEAGHGIKKKVPIAGNQLPPPTKESLERVVNEQIWKTSRYRAGSEWNAGEGHAFLNLLRRDLDPQHFEITVEDPTHIETKHAFTTAGGGITDLYPDQFKNAPRPLVSGVYKVTWRAVVEENGRPVLRVAAKDEFRVPH
jgi:hypothetical protein